ncbi:MAG TPA: hypothetical protein VFN77_02165 [Acetobacteraceae bacterium]|nr:hypothetical protein [Acetobacteraceae bacterium]
MAGKTSEGGAAAREAENLVRQGEEAKRHGDQHEARFLIEAGREIDSAIATETLKTEEAAAKGKK